MSKHAQKHEHRLRRQFRAFARIAPASRGMMERLLHHRARLIRVPVAVLFMLGGVFSVLPVLGFWMLPVGLMLLAVDVPALRPRVSAAVIHGRRRFSIWRRRLRSE